MICRQLMEEENWFEQCDYDEDPCFPELSFLLESHSFSLKSREARKRREKLSGGIQTSWKIREWTLTLNLPLPIVSTWKQLLLLHYIYIQNICTILSLTYLDSVTSYLFLLLRKIEKSILNICIPFWSYFKHTDIFYYWILKANWKFILGLTVFGFINHKP